MSRCKIPGDNFGKLIETRCINTSSVAGMKVAEKLKEEGWKIGRSGFWTVDFFRYVEDETYLQLKAAGKLNQIV